MSPKIGYNTDRPLIEGESENVLEGRATAKMCCQAIELIPSSSLVIAISFRRFPSEDFLLLVGQNRTLP